MYITPISLDPNAFGSPLLSWVALFTIAGALAGGGMFLRQAGALGTSRRTLYGTVLAALFWGLVGARLFHVVDYWDFYTKAPFQAFYFWNGGLSLWGGALVGLAVGLWRTGRSGLSAARVADAAVVPALIGLAIGRCGDLLAGERAASGSSLPWAVVYANDGAEAFADGSSVHPVALYEMLLDLAIAAAVARWRHRLPEGALMPAALAAWALGRFLIAFVRLDPAHLGLQQTQWVGLIVVAVATLWAWRSRHRLRPYAGR